MNLREQILQEHTKENCNTIVEWVGNSQARFDELFYLFLQDEYRVVQRSAWPVSYCVEANPSFIKKHFAKLLNNLSKPGVHNAVKRNTVRLLQYVHLPKSYQGKIMDACFKFIESPDEAVAVKAFSLNILGKLSKQYPEIIPEIKLIIEEQLPHQTAAFKSVAKRLIREWPMANGE